MEKDTKTKLWNLFDLGKSYEFGYEPYSLDYQKALECYMQCVELLEFVADWHPTSVLLEKIGDFYYEGKGVKKDYEEALNWYNKALVYPDPSNTVYIRLGEMYVKGEGTEIDMESAAKLYQLAADNYVLYASDALEHLRKLNRKGLLDIPKKDKRERAFVQRDMKYKVLDVRTWIDTLKFVDPDSFTDEDPVETMDYQEYRDKVFPMDLQKYFGNGELENVSERWNGQIRHYHLFTATLFNYVLYAQVIGNACGKKQLREFLAATGIPAQFGQRAAFVHPVRLFCKLGLIPHRNCIDDFLPIFREVSAGFDSELPRLFEKGDTPLPASMLKEELEKQRAYYEQWIGKPDARCPRFYLTLNKRI